MNEIYFSPYFLCFLFLFFPFKHFFSNKVSKLFRSNKVLEKLKKYKKEIKYGTRETTYEKRRENSSYKT
jgi:hypothetical protein